MLNQLGRSLSESEKLAEDVLRLSDHFIQSPGASTPWSEVWAQAAYLSYFLPLNSLRVARAAQKAAELGFFKGLNTVHDFGSGLGAATWTLFPHLPSETSWNHWEVSPEAIDIHQRIVEQPPRHTWHRLDLRAEGLPEIPKSEAAGTLAVFSYSMVELGLAPHWKVFPEALLIIEPSTRDEGRKLLFHRQRLLKDWGYQAWAPCPHQEACPLLTDSEKDWCHDRLHWTQPEWFQGISKHLPMKNHTLTHSYLALRKTPTPVESAPDALPGRIVGDELREKGRTRFLICTGPQRRFLTWLQRQGPTPHLERGDLVAINPGGVEFRDREIRWKEKEAIKMRSHETDRS